MLSGRSLDGRFRADPTPLVQDLLMTSRAAVGLGTLPLAAGALLPQSALSADGLPCPWRALTGLPCPLCGATRAFVHAGHLDAAFLDYGAVWVVAAVALIIAGLARRRLPAWSLVPVLALAWAWALANASTIAP
jgi:Protein of unknown function (DUF2752)